MQRNEGFINLGNSLDTTEFACDSLRQWWQQVGKLYYAFATSILLLCDGEGSNSSNYYIFKEDLQTHVTQKSKKVSETAIPSKIVAKL